METTETNEFFGLIFAFTGVLAIMSIAFFLLFRAFKKRIEREQALLRSVEINFERDINEATLQAEQRERVQIAMDLHDEIGALVTVLKINVLNAKNRIGKPDELLEILDETAGLIEQTAETIRSISNRISPPTLAKLGLDATLEEMVKTINATGKMTVVYQSNLEGGRFQLDAELNIYRIIIETIHNILKHGQTTQLNLKLAQQNDALNVYFKYQGLGLTNAQVNQLLREQEGMGLKSIQTRINNFGAKINYSIDKKGNAEIEINIPIHELRN